MILCTKDVYWSQTFGSHKVTPLNKNFKVKEFDEEGYRKKLNSKYEYKLLNKRSRTNFIDILIEDKKTCLNIPDYDDWQEATDYVSKIAHKVLPETYFSEGRKVSILRSSEVNAFCFEDGTIYITIGMMALLSNEAELAAILAHEYGHMLHEDAYKEYQTFLNAYNNMLIPNPKLSEKSFSEKSISKELMQHETAADLMAVSLFNECSYSLNSAVSLLTKFKTLEDLGKRLKDYKSPRGKYIQTHPLANERIDHMKKQLPLMKPTANRSFLIDSALFFKVKKRSTDELIYLKFYNKDHYNCLATAYKELVKNPTDPFYSFFVFESLQRLLIADKTMENKYFITSEFHTTDKNKDGVPKLNNSSIKYQYVQGIFYNYGDIYPFDPELAAIHNCFTNNDTIEFVTYKEAYNYFYNGLKDKCKTCNYSLVLNDSVKDIISSNFDLNNEPEAILYNELVQAKNFKNTVASNTKIPMFLDDVIVSEGSVQYNQLTVSVSSFVREMFENKMSSQPTPFDHFFYQKLNFRDHNLMRIGFDFSEGYYYTTREKSDSKYRKAANLTNKYTVLQEFKKLSPEQLALASTFDYTKLIWVNIYSITKASVGDKTKDSDMFRGAKTTYRAVEERTTYYATVYCMDLASNTISSLTTDSYIKKETSGVMVNKISLTEFKNDNAEIFNHLFNDIIGISEKLIKNQ